MGLIEPDNDGIEPIIVTSGVRTVLLTKNQWAIIDHKMSSMFDKLKVTLDFKNRLRLLLFLMQLHCMIKINPVTPSGRNFIIVYTERFLHCVKYLWLSRSCEFTVESSESTLGPVNHGLFSYFFFLVIEFNLEFLVLFYLCLIYSSVAVSKFWKIEMDGPKTRKPGPIESIDPDIESEKKTKVKGNKRKV